jgi:hypothetical protein
MITGVKEVAWVRIELRKLLKILVQVRYSNEYAT